MNIFEKIKKMIFGSDHPVVISTVDKYSGKTRKDWWVTKYPEKPVIYNAQDSSPRDVRNFIFTRSYILEDVVKRYRLKGVDDTDTMYKCCVFIQDHVKYVGDEKSRGQVEYWQYPEDTATRGTGDCEDMSILMKSLTLCAGIPDWKVKILAGSVKGGGHAYCVFIRDNDNQVVMDGCYWPNRLHVNKRPRLEDEKNYGKIWFSFNHKHSYAETKTSYCKGKI